jgi:hypothetical protein
MLDINAVGDVEGGGVLSSVISKSRANCVLIVVPSEASLTVANPESSILSPTGTSLKKSSSIVKCTLVVRESTTVIGEPVRACPFNTTNCSTP